MIVAKIQVSGVIAHTLYKKVIPAGIIGAQVELEYCDDIWQGLSKTVVFEGTVTKDVVTDADVVTIPVEVVAKHGDVLRVGVYGVDADGNIAIPTIWAYLGVVCDSANPSGDTSTDPALPVWAQIQAMIGNLDDLETTAKNNLVAAVNEAMTEGGGEVDAAEIQRIVDEYLAANPPTVTETDPTVPEWAKQPQKPTYTAEEVHALPDTYTPPNQTAQQVGADPAGTAASAVSQHNTDATAHNDLRIALQELANRINAALDSDDTTLDQMSEVVAYIKSNKSLIDAITTSKVSVADIVNDLVTNVTDKPLSAAQGVAIKGLIDELRALIPDAYTLPTATETTLGGVKPVTATEEMTQPVGVDAEGRLMTKPGSGGSGISVTGATVGQTVKIAAVNAGGVPTAWEPVDFPSGGGSVIGKFKLLAKVNPITEPVAKIEVSIEDDGITEIYLVGRVKEAEDTSYDYAFVAINGKSASCNTGISATDERSVIYHGTLLEGGYCLFDFKISLAPNSTPNYSLSIPQNGFDGFGEQIKTVSLIHSAGYKFAVGASFYVWGR